MSTTEESLAVATINVQGTATPVEQVLVSGVTTETETTLTIRVGEYSRELTLRQEGEVHRLREIAFAEHPANQGFRHEDPMGVFVEPLKRKGGYRYAVVPLAYENGTLTALKLLDIDLNRLEIPSVLAYYDALEGTENFAERLEEFSSITQTEQGECVVKMREAALVHVRC